MAESRVQDPEPAPLSRLLLNLGLLALAGTLVFAWVMYYSEWGALAATAAGLGGFFALLSRMLGEERRKELQGMLENGLLASPGLTPAVLLLLAALAGLAFGSGSVRLDARGEAKSRTVKVENLGRGRGDGDGAGRGSTYLPAGGTLKIPLWVMGRYRLKVSGLPALEVEVSPLERRLLPVPEAFLRRPLLLVRPEPEVSHAAAGLAAAGLPYCLVARLEPAATEVPPRTWIYASRYAGETLWVGCERDVEIPPQIVERWRLALRDPGHEERTLLRWSRPGELAPRHPLADGDRVGVWLLKNDEDEPVYALADEILEPPLRPGDPPQETILAPAVAAARGWPAGLDRPRLRAACFSPP